jgi:hypothetical protein
MNILEESLRIKQLMNINEVIAPVDINDIDTIQIMLDKGEEFFGTQNDPNQLPTNMETLHKLLEINPNTIIVKKDDNGDFVGCAAFLPTTTDLMDLFLTNKITENQMFEMTTPNIDYDAIYVISVFVDPSFKNGGSSRSLIIQGITPLLKDGVKIFFEGFSDEGSMLGKIFAKRYGIEVINKNDYKS